MSSTASSTLVPDRKARSWRWTVVLIVAALVASCNDDDENSASPTTATATTAATTSAAAGAAEPTTATTTTAPGFTFGFVAPGAGLLDELAVAQERALGLAVEEINGAGGLLGQPVASVTVSEDPDRPIADTIGDLADQGAGAVLGPVGSTSAAAALPALAERQLVGCSASATLPSLTDGNSGDTFFRTSLPDDQLVAYVADQFTAERDALDPAPEAPVRVTVLARGDEYGTSVGNGLASTLTGRGFEASVIAYNPRTLIFTNEVAEVVAGDPDRAVIVAYEEAPLLLGDLVEAGFPADRIAGLDGMFTPRLAEQTFPDQPERIDGITLLGTTGDRAFMRRLSQQPGQQQIAYGAQLYDCAITVALAAAAAQSVEPTAFAPQMRPVTDGGRRCSTYAHCVELLEAGEDIDYEGTTGGIAFDEHGDPTTVRFTVASFEGGEVVVVSNTDVDLAEVAQQEAFSAAVFTSQLQQSLKLLGYYTGQVTGIYDEATTDAVRALQRDLGLEETGQYDEATDAALRARAGAVGLALTTATSQLQQTLTDLGFYSGPIDGTYSAATVEAVKALQRELAVPETGIIDAPTLRAAYERGLATAPPATTVPSTTTVLSNTTLPPDTSVPDTASPETDVSADTTIAPPGT